MSNNDNKNDTQNFVNEQFNNYPTENKELSEEKKNKKDKGIDYLFIFITVRIFHFFLVYFKYFLELLISHPKFDKNQILWWFPIFKNYDVILDMNNQEFKVFILGFINKFEKEILTNKNTIDPYRIFIDDVIYNFEWNLHEKNLESKNLSFSTSYSFESDLHYIIDIISKLHLPISQNKIRNTLNLLIEKFDLYTESPEKNRINLKDTFYNCYQYVHTEVYNYVTQAFSWIKSNIY
jgi:hypothetical protein